MGEMIQFTRPDGGTAPGYLARGASGAPGIVMLEEWWGVTDQITASADRLAAEGFSVLIPDLYRGRKAAIGDEATHLMQGLDFSDAATQDAVGAGAYLREHGAKHVGVMGFCMGGALTFLAAMYGSGFDAASAWYGYPPPEAGDPSKIAIPLQGHWAQHDEYFPLTRVSDIETKLKERGTPVEFYTYDAHHGFYNPNQVGESGLGHYNREAAELAWQRTVSFFKKALA